MDDTRTKDGNDQENRLDNDVRNKSHITREKWENLK